MSYARQCKLQGRVSPNLEVSELTIDAPVFRLHLTAAIVSCKYASIEG
jgi:hypothetical protein